MGHEFVDAGTKNAIKLWKPPGGSISAFMADDFKSSSYWFEVSVLGFIYTIDPTSTSKKRNVITS